MPKWTIAPRPVMGKRSKALRAEGFSLRFFESVSLMDMYSKIFYL